MSGSTFGTRGTSGPGTSAAFGVLSGLARQGLVTALSKALGSAVLTTTIAEHLYENETGRRDWSTLPATERAIWLRRVELVVRKLVESIGPFGG